MDLVDQTTSPVRIEIQLEVGGSELLGKVVDAEGRGIAGARVVVGDTRQGGNFRGDQSWEEVWAPRSALTAAAGAFSLAGLPPGEHPVQVRATGYALWQSQVELKHKEASHLEVKLARGAELSGKVTDIDGKPVPKATILVFHEPIGESYLQGGQVDYYGPFLSPAAVCPEDGTYRLEQVPTGTLFLYALDPLKEGFVLYHDIRYTKTTRSLEDGQEAVWNPVLSDGARHRRKSALQRRSPHRRGLRAADWPYSRRHTRNAHRRRKLSVQKPR